MNTRDPTSTHSRTHKQSMYMNTHGHTPHTHMLMAEAQSSAIGVYDGSHPVASHEGCGRKEQGTGQARAEEDGGVRRWTGSWGY